MVARKVLVRILGDEAEGKATGPLALDDTHLGHYVHVVVHGGGCQLDHLGDLGLRLYLSPLDV